MATYTVTHPWLPWKCEMAFLATSYVCWCLSTEPTKIMCIGEAKSQEKNQNANYYMDRQDKTDEHTHLHMSLHLYFHTVTSTQQVKMATRRELYSAKDQRAKTSSTQQRKLKDTSGRNIPHKGFQ